MVEDAIPASDKSIQRPVIAAMSRLKRFVIEKAPRDNICQRGSPNMVPAAGSHKAPARIGGLQTRQTPRLRYGCTIEVAGRNRFSSISWGRGNPTLV
jgi:hypothetical protein